MVMGVEHQSTKGLGSANVYSFAEGVGLGALVLGGKGAGLARMTALGIPVPPGFTVSCEAARSFRSSGEIPHETLDSIKTHLRDLERSVGRHLGSSTKPLLVSVRSGAPVSMPGMMDTVLNVGINESVVAALARESDDPAFAWSCYRRFVESYARIVRDIDANDIDDALFDLDRDATDIDITRAILALVERVDGVPIPSNPVDQVREAVEAVFRSWDSPRAVSYRNFRGIDEELCTAATVQVMVFGNMGNESASGVAFTRNPSTGMSEVFGDILFNAQGEDVVAGERDADSFDTLQEILPRTAGDLAKQLKVIETDARDLCEVEFTIQEAELWILQTRVGLRSGRAAVRVAVDLVNAGVLEIEEALTRVTPAQLQVAMEPGLEVTADSAVRLGEGLAASPGAARGQVVFNSSRAITLADAGNDVVLVRPTTSPADVAGFIAAVGVVTGKGGRTSHAAVVARGMHRPAVCGIGEVVVASDGLSASLNGHLVHEGEDVSVDGDRGLLLLGRQPLGQALDEVEVTTFLEWCSERARVPWLDSKLLDGLRVVVDAAELEAATSQVVIELDDPSRFPPVDLARILSAFAGTLPVLNVSARWLRSADVRLAGRVAGITGPSKSAPAIAMLRAVLSSDE